jgi:uncharacterized protein (TIGR03435 family)
MRFALLIILSAFPIPGQQFEAASIKLAPVGPPSAHETGGPGSGSPGQWSCFDMPLGMLVQRAWDLDALHIANAADLNGQRYDIVAKIPPDTSPADFRRMIQHLLLERLSMRVHTESREISGLELTVAKGGLKMKTAEAAPEGPAPTFRGPMPDRKGNLQLPAGYASAITVPTRDGGFSILGRKQSIEGLAKQLQWAVGEPVVDRTGLTGEYDFNLTCSGEEARPDIPGARAACVKSALDVQLGLKVTPAKARIDVLVVDHFSKLPIQ